MDDIARYNRERWEALVQANALFTRPWLNLEPASARARLDPANTLGDVRGKDVLVLAGGGGQQSAAFGVLGANVTVVDLTDAQLARDRDAASRYGLDIRTVQGDMRDLSMLPRASFDIVWHPYSLNFVPDCRVVFEQVARTIKKSGLYHFMAANPFVCGLGTQDWNGRGYGLRDPYVDGAEVVYRDEEWVYPDSHRDSQIKSPREYRQTLSTLINGLFENGFILMKILEWASDAPPSNAKAATWDHFRLLAPPWFRFWTQYRPEFTSGT